MADLVLGDIDNEMNKYSRLIVTSFFLLLISLGIIVAPDYGVSWDEAVNRTNGMISLNHVLNKVGLKKHSKDEVLNKFDTPLATYADRDYGVAFELPLAAIERVLSLKDERQQYIFRHIATYLAFLIGVFAMYLLAKRRFSSWKWGLLAAVFMMLSPRFFAEGFYNSKDIVFMSFFALAMNTMLVFIEKPAISNGMIHALVTAIAIDIRVMGIVLVFITFVMVILEILRGQYTKNKVLGLLGAYILLTVLLTILLWPWLWSDPWGNFKIAIKNMSHYRWHEYNFYLGSYIPASRVPWHYAPVWIGITAPVLYLVLFIIGCLRIVERIIKKRKLYVENNGMQDLVFFGIFNGAILGIIILRSVLYDGWRQLYFLYPAFLLIAVVGLNFLWNINKNKKILNILIIFIISISSLQTLTWMIKNHPLQNVYFNEILGSKSYLLFEKDYWGLGNKQALEYILKLDKRDVIKVWPISDTPILNGLVTINKDESKRIQLAENIEEADYLINNYRYLKGPIIVEAISATHLFNQIKINNEIIISVYKIK